MSASENGGAKSLREALANFGKKLDERARRARPGTVAEALDRATERLAAAGIDAPRRSAELLAERAFGLSRLGLIVRKKDEVSLEQQTAFDLLVGRREKGEPVAYLLGEKEFFGLELHVTPAVLIPRPETETIVEQARKLFPADAPLVFADFGTGSGALAIALAHVFPNSRGTAVDLCLQALDVARRNARRHEVSDRLELREGDMRAALLPDASCDLIVSNPPYVTEAEYAGLSPEVRDFEPRLALVSPARMNVDDGLEHLRGLLPRVAAALRPGGHFLCEIGAGQGHAALAAARELAPALADAAILPDLAGLDRVLCIRKP